MIQIDWIKDKNTDTSDVSPHVVLLRESCLKLESIMPAWDRKDPK